MFVFVVEAVPVAAAKDAATAGLANTDADTEPNGLVDDGVGASGFFAAGMFNDIPDGADLAAAALAEKPVKLAG